MNKFGMLLGKILAEIGLKCIVFVTKSLSVQDPIHLRRAENVQVASSTEYFRVLHAFSDFYS